MSTVQFTTTGHIHTSQHTKALTRCHCRHTYDRPIRSPMLSGSEPTKLLADRSMLTTAVLPLLHVSPCHEHGETLVLPQATPLRTRTVQLHPAVATYKSISASRPGKSQLVGRLVAPVMQVPAHDDALAGNRDVSPDGTAPWRPLKPSWKYDASVILRAESVDGTVPTNWLFERSR